jgi:hypothetical protein
VGVPRVPVAPVTSVVVMTVTLAHPVCAGRAFGL